jgi:NTE family protein
VHSSTNADVLKAHELDTVVVVSSMSARRGRAIGADGFLRWSVHRRLEREIARLEAQGTSVIRLEPGPEARHAMGVWAMAENRAPQVIEAAYEETRKRILSSPFLAAIGTAAPAAAG